MKLAGLSAIVTGGSQGLGLEIAKHYLQEGANVALCARNAEKLAEAQEALSLHLKNKAQLIVLPVDVAKPEQVDLLVNATLEAFGRIDVLVANAGVYGPKGPIDEVDWDDWSKAVDINIKGTVLPCRAVLQHMKRQQHGKIIILSGGGATRPMPNLSAYATSKAAIVRFAETLAEEVAPHHIDVNTIAPGALNTRLLDEILEAGPEKVGDTFYAQSLKQKQTGGTSLDVGARLCVFLGASESDGITGRLISAVWDPWQTLPSMHDKLKNSDIYTLRRIVPEDRGQNWDEVK
jgi:NAD(P)-dependent dehydrogenase (short-subunit alcohol dehydrogenase family)